MALKRLQNLGPTTLLIFLFLGLLIAGRILHVPVGSWLLSVSSRYYQDYGYLAVFLGAFVEGLLVVSLYLPGSTIVILGAVASRSGILNIWAVIGVSSIGFFLAYVICYTLGWFGWYSGISRLGVAKPLEKTRVRMLEVGPRLICVANIHPNLGALAATASGILRVPFRKFVVLSIISETSWTVFWGLIAYSLGKTAIDLFNSWLLIPIIIILLATTLYGSKAQKQ